MHELSHVLQPPLVALLDIMKASQISNALNCIAVLLSMLQLQKRAPDYSSAYVFHLYSRKLRGGKARKYPTSLTSVQKIIYTNGLL